MKTRFLQYFSIALLLTAIVGVSYSCKDDDPVVPPVAPPVVVIEHSISGLVLAPGEKAIAGAKVVATLGTAKVEAATNDKGEFTFDKLKEAGTYAFVISAAERIDFKGEVVIAADGKSHREALIAVLNKKPVEEKVKEEVKVVIETKEEAQKVADTATKTEDAVPAAKVDLKNVTPEQVVQVKEPVKVEAKTETKETETVANVAVTIPAQTVIYIKDDKGTVVDVPKDLAITIAPTANVVSAGDKSETANVAHAPAVASVVCSPTGLSFATPIDLTISNPLGEESFENIRLYYLNEKTQEWEEQDAQVTADKDVYKARINHFSAYTVKLPSVTPIMTTVMEPLDIKGVDNTKGSKVMKDVKLPYTCKQGVEISNVKQACSAVGLSDNAANMIVSMISNLVGTSNATSVSKEYATGVDLTVGQGIQIVSALQQVKTKTFNFGLRKAGAAKAVQVTVKVYGACNIEVKGYGTDHSGSTN